MTLDYKQQRKHWGKKSCLLSLEPRLLRPSQLGPEAQFQGAHIDICSLRKRVAHGQVCITSMERGLPPASVLPATRPASPEHGFALKGPGTGGQECPCDRLPVRDS